MLVHLNGDRWKAGFSHQERAASPAASARTADHGRAQPDPGDVVPARLARRFHAGQLGGLWARAARVLLRAKTSVSSTVLVTIAEAIPSETRRRSSPGAKTSTNTNSAADSAHATAPPEARAIARSACEIVAEAR